MEKELICEDYYFYSDNYSTKTTFRGVLFCNDNDLVHESSTCVRLYGTKQEVSEALDEYVERTGLALDECYTYEIEKEGTFFYDAKRNIEIEKKLEIYKAMYESHTKALTINLI